MGLGPRGTDLRKEWAKWEKSVPHLFNLLFLQRPFTLFTSLHEREAIREEIERPFYDENTEAREGSI